MDGQAPEQLVPSSPAPADKTTGSNDDLQHALIRRLVSWARDEHGAWFPKLQFDHAGGRPRRLLLAAGASADAGEPLIRVPRALLILGAFAFEDAEYGEAFAELRNMIEQGGDHGDAEAADGADHLDPRSALVLLVAIERCRGNLSRWAPYIAALPLEYDDPAWWSPEDRARLQGTRLGAAADRYDRQGLATIAARLRLLERLRRRLGRSGGPLSEGAAGPGGWGPVEQPGEALKAARWARSVVWSRAFGVARFCGGAAEGGGGGAAAAAPRPAVCLVPVLDMADHHPDARVAWHLGEDGRADALEFSSRVPLLASVPPPPPHELLNNYGIAKPTEELVLAYGFDLGPDYARRHDGFLVSVALGGAGGGEGEGGDESRRRLSAEAWDERAALQLRRAAVAGMARDVMLPPPPSSDAPSSSPPRSLPPALLDLLLAAAGAPDWSLLLPQRRQQQQPPSPPPSYARAPPAWRLAALDALEAQLRAKRAPLAWAEREDQGDGLETRHGRMARSYALGQLARLDEALAVAGGGLIGEARAAAALDALRPARGHGGDLPPPLAPHELARAGLRAEWAAPPGASSFVREPWSLARPPSCPPAVGLLLLLAAAPEEAPPSPLPLLRLPLDACLAVPLAEGGEEEGGGDEDAAAASRRRRVDAESALIRAAAEALEAQALDWGRSTPQAHQEQQEQPPSQGRSWLLASARADAADGLLSAALLVAAAAAAAARSAADDSLAAEAASAASVRELVVLARGGEEGCDPDDDYAAATRRLCARGIGGQGEEDGGNSAAAAALRAACCAHAALLVTRGGVVVADQEEEDDCAKRRRLGRRLVLAPVLSRLGGPVLSALPLEARVVAASTLEVSLRVLPRRAISSGSGGGGALLFGLRTGAAAEGRLAAAVAAEAGLAAAFSFSPPPRHAGEAGAWPAAVAGAVPWSRAVDEDDDEDDEDGQQQQDVALQRQARLLLAACCVGVGELLLLPPPTAAAADAADDQSPPPPQPLSRVERLVLAEVLAGLFRGSSADDDGDDDDDDDDKEAAEALVMRSTEARELLDAQAASARAGSASSSDEAASSSASGLPPPPGGSSSGARAADATAAAERRLDAARRAFAARCFADLRDRCKEAARGLQRALKEMAEEAEGREGEAAGGDDGSDGRGNGGSDPPPPPLAELVARAWIGADARTFKFWSDEVGRWRKAALGGEAKKKKKKKKKRRRREEEEDEDGGDDE